MKVKALHRYDYDIDTVFKAFCDKEFYLEKFGGVGARNIEVLECSGANGGFAITTQRDVPSDVPGMLKNFLGEWNTIVQSEEWQVVEDRKYNREMIIGLRPFFKDNAPEDMKGFYSEAEIAELEALRGTDRDVEARMPVKMTRHYFELAKSSPGLQRLVKASPEETLDLAGHTVIPGLVGLHNHSYYTGGNGRAAQLSFSGSRLYLASGVTTIRTTGAQQPYAELNLKEDIEAGRMIGPTMFATGPYLTGEQGSQTMTQLHGPEQARRVVRGMD